MLLQTELGGRQKTVGDGEQPGFPITMPAPIDGNGFEAEIDRSKMGAGGDAGFAQDRSAKQPAEPGRMLQNREFVPGIEDNDRLRHRRQVSGLAQDAAPFVEPLVLVPVEIIDQRIGRSPAGLFGSFDRGVRAREDRIDRGIVDAGEIFGVVTIIPLPFRIDRGRGPNDAGRRRLVPAARPDLRGFPQRADSVRRQDPAGELSSDTPAGAQDVAGR